MAACRGVVEEKKLLQGAQGFALTTMCLAERRGRTAGEGSTFG